MPLRKAENFHNLIWNFVIISTSSSTFCVCNFAPLSRVFPLTFCNRGKGRIEKKNIFHYCDELLLSFLFVLVKGVVRTKKICVNTMSVLRTPTQKEIPDTKFSLRPATGGGVRNDTTYSRQWVVEMSTLSPTQSTFCRFCLASLSQWDESEIFFSFFFVRKE